MCVRIENEGTGVKERVGVRLSCISGYIFSDGSKDCPLT